MLQPACKCNDIEPDYDDYNLAYNYDDSDADYNFDSRFVTYNKNFVSMNTLAIRIHTPIILTMMNRRESDAT